MTHGTTWGSVTFKLANPIDVNNDPSVRIIGRWAMSATLSNTFLGNGTVDQIKQWWNENARNNEDPLKNLIKIGEVSKFRMSNDAIASADISNSASAIVKLERLIDSNDPAIAEAILEEIALIERQKELSLLQSQINGINTEMLRLNDWFNGGVISLDDYSLQVLTLQNEIRALVLENQIDEVEINEIMIEDPLDIPEIETPEIIQSPQTNNNKALLALIGLAVLS